MLLSKQPNVSLALDKSAMRVSFGFISKRKKVMKTKSTIYSVDFETNHQMQSMIFLIHGTGSLDVALKRNCILHITPFFRLQAKMLIAIDRSIHMRQL